ncbi:MAG TPA: xanthine dehydrogenase family protein subunit M [Acidimicrobiales bacterium]
MTVLVPTGLDEALHMLGDTPGADVLAGGTDLMNEVNHGSRRPPAIVAVHRVGALRGWSEDGDGMLRIGAGTTYTDMLDPAFARLCPALTAASRTVGSPQIRNAGTIGGNLGTASPAGDTIPVLAALDAQVVVASVGGERRLGIPDFITGVKRTALRPDELIVEVIVPAARPGDAQEYLKVGTRNAMVISVAGVALVVHGGTVRVALGSVGPLPIRATEAEAWASTNIDWTRRHADLEQFGALVAAAARPIDDHRSTADYRRHAVGVLAARALRRALDPEGAAA